MAIHVPYLKANIPTLVVKLIHMQYIFNTHFDDKTIIVS